MKNQELKCMELGSSTDNFPSFKVYRRAMDVHYLTQLLTICAGNIVMASKVSGIARPYLYKTLERHGLKPQSFRIYKGASEAPSQTTHKGAEFELECERRRIRVEERALIRRQLQRELEQKGIIHATGSSHTRH